MFYSGTYTMSSLLFVTWLPADPAVDLRNLLEARGVPDRGAADWVQEEQLLSPW